MTNDSGPALAADRIQVDASLYLHHAFTATGTGELGAVRLAGAHIGGQLGISGTMFNDSGPALQAEELRVERGPFLRHGFTATGTGYHGAVNLAGAHVGRLEIHLTSIQHTTGGPGSMSVDGLVYTGLPMGPTVAGWLAALACRTPTTPHSRTGNSPTPPAPPDTTATPAKS